MTSSGGAERVVSWPGWIDLQVNGFAGVDFNKPDVTDEALELARLELRRVGATRFLPTVITGPVAGMSACLARMAQARDANPAFRAAVPGFHVEGPFISALDGARGAHPRESVIPPSLDVFDRLQDAAGGAIRLLTLAPEHEGSLAFIEELVSRGVTVSIGHSLASSARLAEAVQAGASMSTHLGNGLPGTLARHPNPLWDQLADERLVAGAIFDGHHLPASVMRVIVRCKAPANLVLVSDAVALAGLPAGVYEGQVGGKVELHDSGRLTMFGSDYLAGSASTLLDGVNTALTVTGFELEDVLPWVTSVPERLLGLPASGEVLELAVTPDGVNVIGVKRRR